VKRLPFRVEMARAWHEGRKTVTRRIVKPQPPSAYKPTGYGIDQWGESKGKWGVEFHDCAHEAKFYPCPYPPGSTVIIAEPLFNKDGIVAYASDLRLVYDYHAATPIEQPNGPPVAATFYTAYEWSWKVRSLSGRYMPNWAARSWARIVSVRVERLQEITEEDAVREGFDSRGQFAGYIDTINGVGTWANNAWVFRYELEKLDRLEATK
jgi:hypothetical protein